jgi:hypothetical protein
MGSRGLVVNEYVSKVAYQAVARAGESTLLPIFDQRNGEPEGVLVASSLERIVVCGREQAALSMNDIRTVQRTMARVQARRAVIYVPAEMTIPNPVLLLATLSQIDVIRMAPASSTPS